MLTAIKSTVVLIHIFRFIVRYFLSFVFSLLNQPYSKFFYQLYFIRFSSISIGFQLPFLMPVSLVQWREEIEAFHGKFQVFFNSSTCCSVAAPSYTSISYNFCFTKLLTLTLITFFSRILLFYRKKLNDNIFNIK